MIVSRTIKNMISDYFANSSSVSLLDGIYKPQTHHIGRRKRGRREIEDEKMNEQMSTIVRELEYSDLMPTLRTLLLKNFYITLANNNDHDNFDEICKVVIEFKALICQADKYTDSGDTENLYFIFVDRIAQLLISSQQLLLLFHLTCKN